VIEDSELEPMRLRRLAGELLDDDERLREMASAARARSRPDAAQRVAAEVLGAIREAAG
jgi:UDP-N-acetylglucosamine:LPS N-acetylglucosamine transferase